MRKNRTMRAAILVIALVLITSCFVGGTFAKYVTEGTANDSARVAKWGVEISATENGSVFANEYQTSVEGQTGLVVEATEKVVAPGTSSEEAGNTLIFQISGKPEVATKVTTTFTGTDVYVGDYHPIVFTLSVIDNNAEINPETVDWNTATTVTGTLEEIEAAIEAAYGEFTAEAGDTLDAMFKIDWEWAYDNGDDVNDTLLGDLAAGTATAEEGTYNTALSYGVTVTITQAD